VCVHACTSQEHYVCSSGRQKGPVGDSGWGGMTISSLSYQDAAGNESSLLLGANVATQLGVGPPRPDPGARASHETLKGTPTSLPLPFFPRIPCLSCLGNSDQNQQRAGPQRQALQVRQETSYSLSLDSVADI
jgi:hypothetical protein